MLLSSTPYPPAHTATAGKLRSCHALTVPWLALLVLLMSAPATAQEWTAQLTTRAGAVDGPGALGEVFKVVMGPGGEILTAQPRAAVISVFDSAGVYQREVGRRGSGPGEFQVVAAMGWTGDTLWVMDAGAARLNLFNRDLEFVRAITPQFSSLPEGVFRALPGPFLADGSVLAIPMILPEAAVSQPLILVDESGAVQRTLPPVPQERRMVMVDRGDGQTMPVVNPWDDSPLWTVAADGGSIVVVQRPIASSAEAGRLRIVRLSLAGDTLLDREYRYTPRPVTAASRDSVYMRAAAASGGGSTPVEEVARRIRDAAPAPASHATVTEVIAAGDGAIWLRREAITPGQQEWQRISESGEMLGTVRLPAALEVHGADDRRVWGLTRDDLDVPFVEVYELRRSGTSTTQ